MRRMIAGVTFALLTAGASSAQGLEYKPIDTSKLVVQPTDTATNIFSGTSRFFSRLAANTIDNNGFVKTINNLLGRKAETPNMYQAGPSRLPDPRMYPSTAYKNSFTPVMPTTQQYGTTPR